MTELSAEQELLNEAFDRTPWDRSTTGVIREALREFVGDGEGIDDLVLTEHDETIRKEAREETLREALDLIGDMRVSNVRTGLAVMCVIEALLEKEEA